MGGWWVGGLLSLMSHLQAHAVGPMPPPASPSPPPTPPAPPNHAPVDAQVLSARVSKGGEGGVTHHLKLLLSHGSMPDSVYEARLG